MLEAVRVFRENYWRMSSLHPGTPQSLFVQIIYYVTEQKPAGAKILQACSLLQTRSLRRNFENLYLKHVTSRYNFAFATILGVTSYVCFEVMPDRSNNILRIIIPCRITS